MLGSTLFTWNPGRNHSGLRFTEAKSQNEPGQLNYLQVLGTALTSPEGILNKFLHAILNSSSKSTFLFQPQVTEYGGI